MSYCDHISFKTFDVHRSSESAQHFFGKLLDPTNYMKKVLSDNSTYDWADYSQHIGKSMGYWSVFFGVTLIVWVATFLVVLYRACCSRKGQGGTTRSTYLCVGVVLALSVAIMGCAAACVAFTDMFYQGVQQSECAAYRLTHDVLGGNTDHGGTFIGINAAMAQLQSIAPGLDSYSADTDANWANSDFLTSDPQNLQHQITNYGAFATRYTKLPSPDPTQSSPVDTVYFEELPACVNGLTGDASSTIVAVDIGLLGIKTGTIDAEPDVSDLVTVLSSAPAGLKPYESGVEKLQSHINSWFLKHSDDIETTWNSLTIAFGYVIVTAVLSTLLTVWIVGTNNPARGKCYYPLWCMWGIVACGGAALASVLVASSLIMKDACGVSDNLSTPEGLAEYNYLIPDDAERLLNQCFNKGGDLPALLGIDISSITTGFASAETELQNLNSINLQTFPHIAQNEAYINAFQGTDYDALIPQGQPKPSSSLTVLNQWSNADAANSLQASKGQCKTPMYDTWIASTADNCPSQTIVSPSNPTGGVGTPVCLVFTAWSAAAVQARYAEFSCQYQSSIGQSVPELIVSYQGALYQFAQAAADSYTELNTSFGQVTAMFVSTGASSSALRSSTAAYLQKYQGTVQDAEDVLDGMNCAFLIQEYNNANMALCKNVLPSLFVTMILTSVLSICALVVLVFVLPLAKRLKDIKNAKQLEAEYVPAANEMR